MIPEIILLVLAIPAGFILAWFARDELKGGKKWFRILFIASLILAELFWLVGLRYVMLTLVFIAIVSFISLVKSSGLKGKG